MKESNLHVVNPLTAKARLLNLDDLCQYDVLQNQYIDQAIKLITQSFCNHEPMTSYLKITHKDFIPFASQVVEKAVRDGLSIGAIVGNKLVACAIVEDYADPFNLTMEIDPNFKFIFGLLDNLTHSFFKNKSFEKNHIAHLFITAVDCHYQGEGLSRKVNLEAVQLAKTRNFDFMCCEFTHPYNQKGTLRNIHTNKLLIGSQTYKEFIFEGEQPFNNLDGSANAYIWELKEKAKLSYRSNDQEYCHSLTILPGTVC